MELKKKLYRYLEVAELLSISVRRVRQLVEAGNLERVFVGGNLSSARITAESIDRYLKELVQLNGSVLNPS
ncbi:MAG: helix-turn-helix domain-containing protein [Terriglobia bacterium]